jgi:hypothetical protein
MILSMLPLFAIGLVHAPFAAGWIAKRPLFDDVRYLLNAIVAAHYFADAFIGTTLERASMSVWGRDSLLRPVGGS